MQKMHYKKHLRLLKWLGSGKHPRMRSNILTSLALSGLLLIVLTSAAQAFRRPPAFTPPPPIAEEKSNRPVISPK
jgi:hypothetical protein